MRSEIHRREVWQKEGNGWAGISRVTLWRLLERRSPVKPEYVEPLLKLLTSEEFENLVSAANKLKALDIMRNDCIIDYGLVLEIISVARIRDVCRKLDADCRVFVFSSFVKGGFRSDSDIDVLIVTKLALNPLSRGALFKAIASEVGHDNPFELHIVTEEYLRVYRKLIDALREVT